LPHLRVGLVLGAAASERLRHGLTGAVFIAQQLPGFCIRNRFDGAPDLPAGCWLLIDHQYFQAQAGSANGGAHAGRTGSNNRQIVVACHAVMLRLPCWRSTVMPSRTATRQVCVDATPSTVARQ